jgi:hypothetical protein
MIDKDADQFGGEPVCKPIIRCETTLRLAPDFQYLDSAPFGETEPCHLGPMNSVQEADAIQRLERIFFRPRMYFDDVDNLRDLMIFVRGVCRGLAPPTGHSFIGEGDFGDYVRQRFGHSPRGSWTTTLLNAFSDRPFFEACEAIAQLIREWKASRRKS